MLSTLATRFAASRATALWRLGWRGRWDIGRVLNHDNAEVRNNLAWLLATASDSTVRDPARALELADKAERLAPEPNPIIYHTLAAAYFATGKTAEAINSDERAEKLAEEAGDAALTDAVRKELETYRKKKPQG